MLRLQCAQFGDLQTHSRIVVLDIDHPKYDYALAAGHAVPEDRPCKALDFEGRDSDIDLIQFAAGYESGAQTDWAVIRFERINTPKLTRYKLEPLGDETSLEGTTIKFADARGLPENGQICRLEILRFREGFRRIVHDCRSIPGQSGSPVTRRVDGEDQLVGLHVGQLWMIESPASGRPDRRGYINLLNSEMVEEIENVIAENR